MNDIEIKISDEFIDYESSIKFMQSRIKQIQNNNQNELFKLNLLLTFPFKRVFLPRLQGFNVT